MKKISLCLAVCLVLLFAVNNCGKKAGTGGITPAVKTSFDEVTSKLDKGGSVYMYISTENVIKTVDELAVILRRLIEKEYPKPQEVDKEALKIFDFVYGIIKKSGLMEISGVGISSVALSETLNHSKFVVHHYRDKGQGLIWNLSSPQPRKLTELEMLPKETVIATFGDFYPGALWKWIKKEAQASDMEKIKTGILAVEPMLQTQGIDLGKLLDSITGMGIVVTLDNENIKKIPLGKIAMEVPDPAAAMVVLVKDDSIFKLLQSKIPIPQKEGEASEQKIEIPVPPMPITMAPLILQRDGMLVIASNNWIVEKMWAARQSGKGLIDTEEFEKMSSHISRDGNGFRFTSARLLQTLMDAQEKITAAEGKEGSEDAQILEFVKKVLPQKLAVYGTVQNTDEGMIWTLNHTMNFSHLVLLPVTAALGIVAAIAVPNIITATQIGKQKSTMGDMKSIGLAVESYIVDHNQAPEAASMEELRAKLEPFYIKTLPLTDGWGNEFLYRFGSGDKKDTYGIASPGQDGAFNGWDQAGFYIVTQHSEFNNDVIFASGQFVYGPKVK